MSDSGAKKPPPGVWTEADHAHARRLNDWLEHDRQKKAGMTIAALARESGMHLSTAHQVLREFYPSSPTHWLTRMQQAIETIERRAVMAKEIPYADTSIARTVHAACVRAKTYAMFAVVSAFVGTGKTRALRHFEEKHDQVYMVEATPMMTADVLLNRLVALTRAEVIRSDSNRYGKGSKDQRTEAVIEKLRGSQALLILDEADKTTPSTLEYMRRISDLCRIGVVLAGTQHLRPMLRDPEGRFGQISSRVNFWPPVIKGITEEDCELLVDTALGKEVDLTEDHYATFWECCDGSARVLVESLIPGVRDYVLRKKQQLTGAGILKVSQEILGFEPRHKVRSWQGHRQVGRGGTGSGAEA